MCTCAHINAHTQNKTRVWRRGAVADACYGISILPQNTERNTGVLLSKVISFPTRYTFQVVGAPGSEPGAAEAFTADVTAVVCGACEVAPADAEVTVKPRLGGKYLSIAVTAMARAPEVVNAAFDKLAADGRVRMRF